MLLKQLHVLAFNEIIYKLYILYNCNFYGNVYTIVISKVMFTVYGHSYHMYTLSMKCGIKMENNDNNYNYVVLFYLL